MEVDGIWYTVTSCSRAVILTF